MTLNLTEQEIAAILAAADRVKSGQKATGTPAAPYVHGPGGLFALSEGEHPILSAMVRPQGLLSYIPVSRADAHRSEFVDTFTGVTAGTGTEPAGICDDPRVAGLKKLCKLVVPFGRQRMRSREWNVPRLGQLRDRFEEITLSANFPVNLMTPDNFFPGSVSTAGNDVSRSELRDRIFEMAVEFQRTLCPLLYTGDPTNNTGDGRDNSGHMQTLGLDLWINAGNKRDAISGAVCYALDSDIKDFNYNKVDSTTADIVQLLTMMYYYVQYNARTMGLTPATWVFAMSPDLWKELSEVWPCRFLTDRCTLSSGASPMVVNDNRNMDLRNDMQQNMFLPIGADRIPVVTDNCIPEANWVSDAQHHDPGEWSSDIYLIPMTVLGGMQATHFQYFDQRRSVSENNVAGVGANTPIWTTDNGMFLWNTTYSDLCYDVRALLEYRLIMHTPQIAGRLQNVKYAPVQKFRDWDPEGLYYKDGGVVDTPIFEFYNQWGTTPSRL